MNLQYRELLPKRSTSCLSSNDHTVLWPGPSLHLGMFAPRLSFQVLRRAVFAGLNAVDF